MKSVCTAVSLVDFSPESHKMQKSPDTTTLLAMPVHIPTPVVVNTRKGCSGMLGLAKSGPGRLLETIAWCPVGFPAGVMSFRRLSFISWPPITPKVTWSADGPFLLLLWSRRTVEHGLSCGHCLRSALCAHCEDETSV